MFQLKLKQNKVWDFGDFFFKVWGEKGLMKLTISGRKPENKPWTANVVN